MNHLTVGLSLVLVVAACGSKGEQADVSDESGNSKTSAKPKQTDPECESRVRAIEPWLTALELETSSHEIGMGATLQVIDRAAVPVERTVDFAVVATPKIEVFDVSTSNYAESTLEKNPSQEDVIARLAAVHEMKAGPDERGAAPDDRIRIDVDAKASWADVVRVVDAAVAAGYTEAVFAFTATSTLTPPPGVDAITKSEEVAMGANTKLGELRGDCRPWSEAVFRHVFNEDRAANARSVAKETADALVACNCAVDLDELQKLAWQDGHWHQAILRVGVRVRLGTDAPATIELPPDTPWSDAHQRLIELSLDDSAPPVVAFVAR